ncbi:MAG TPA: 6-phosphogluconolactonase, partial [Acidimicrobiales bacterium]|nr:6-phosphogluconolactonase [Acidimicrobiales bacterium]
MIGEVRVVEDVPLAFATLATEAIRSSASPRFVLGCSGGSSGAACFAALATRDLPWTCVEVVFADERCVPADSPEYNGHAIAVALGPRLAEVAAYHPMSCADGPEPYAALLESLGGIDLLQLGLGPDGHTASI